MIKFNIKTDLPNAILNAGIISVLVMSLFTALYIAKIGVGYHDDDVYLLSNAVFYSYSDLLTKPLTDAQCCPFLHIILLKFYYENIGLNMTLLRGLAGLLPFFLAIITMPLVAYKVCKSRFAVFISLSLLSFNWYTLYYAQRLKQYSTDIFLTIFLILLGYIFFSTPITKKKMIFFTVICIICASLSYTSIIIITCLCFYYLILFQKDNIKTKIINFSILIIPILMIFIPYLTLIGINNIHNPEQTSYWRYFISNFEDFKEMILYLFGHENYYSEMEVHSFFTFSENFWYIFIPILIGIITILIKKDKYLFCVLILPIFISQLLGIAHIYPISAGRTSLWLMPIFILLFVLPVVYIKFNKQFFFSILSAFIIIYYLWIYYNPSIDSIKLYIDGYPFGRTFLLDEVIEEFKKSDITKNDIIVFQREINWKAFDNIFDVDRKFDKNLKIGMTSYVDNPTCTEGVVGECTYSKLMLFDENMYFYFFREFYDTEAKYEWIKQNMNVIYEYETWYGDKILKARKK